MNSVTRECLKEFIEKVSNMAFYSGNFIGTDCAKEVMEACEELKDQLDKDETIP